MGWIIMQFVGLYFLDFGTCLLFLYDRFVWLLCWKFFGDISVWKFWIIWFCSTVETWCLGWYFMLFCIILVISSSIVKSLISGLFGLFLYGVDMDMNFIFFGWSGNGQFISRWFFCSAYELSFIYETISASLFCSGYICLWSLWFTVDLTWMIRNDEKSLLRSDWFECMAFWYLFFWKVSVLVSFWRYLVCNDNFTVGSVMDMVIDSCAPPEANIVM